MSLHRGTTHKVFVVYNSIDEGYKIIWKFTPLVKVFWKFYIENGEYFDSVATFVEVKSADVAWILGIT